ncbi:hypothetical protein MJ588_05140 [Klebsiella pneumoniae]|nr:hypothetical protein MJ588_05140 [Klebsiella pneumoniae]
MDSILIDEARTPLIISGPAEDSSEMYRKVNKIIPHLIRQEKEDSDTFTGEGHFSVDEKARQVNLTERGLVLIEELLVQEGIMDEGESLYSPTNIMLMHHVLPPRCAPMRCSPATLTTLSKMAKLSSSMSTLAVRCRAAAGPMVRTRPLRPKRAWRSKTSNQTLASITFQNYFRLYEKLAGMTGTADTEAFEFSSIYKLDTVVKTDQPSDDP